MWWECELGRCQDGSATPIQTLKPETCITRQEAAHTKLARAESAAISGTEDLNEYLLRARGQGQLAERNSGNRAGGVAAQGRDQHVGTHGRDGGSTAGGIGLDEIGDGDADIAQHGTRRLHDGNAAGAGTLLAAPGKAGRGDEAAEIADC